MQSTKWIGARLRASWSGSDWTPIRPTLIVTIVALSVACGSESPTAPTATTPSPPAFTLTGTVMEVRADVRTPARNIAVDISPTYESPTSWRTVTNSAGHFSIPGLAEGTYVVNVRGWLYEPLSTTVRIQGDTWIDLEIVPLPIYAVSGTVYEDTEDGPIPVPGVYVNNSEIHDSGTTDANGAYRVFALRGGASISFSKNGYVEQAHTIVMESDVRLDVRLVRR